jgi:Kdo2-lipid IVA lauroyltransferase/acyltransferase
MQRGSITGAEGGYIRYFSLFTGKCIINCSIFILNSSLFLSGIFPGRTEKMAKKRIYTYSGKCFLQNKLEYFLFLMFSGFFRMLGLKNARKFSGVVAAIFFYLVPIRKKTVLENLKKAFPEKSEKEINKIAFATYKSFSTALIEILLMPSMSRKEIEAAVDVPDEFKQLILKRFNEGNGVILLSAHFGNWEYIAASVSAQINLPLYAIVKSQRNPYVNQWMNAAREKWLNKVVPLGMSVREIFKQLKEKRVVAMVADQRGPSDGIRVNLFGMRTSVYPGPAMLALKTKAPIIIGLNVRQKDNSYKVFFEEVCMENLPEKDEDKIIEISQRHTEFLERYVRQYPEQWLWMHKRWKY